MYGYHMMDLTRLWLEAKHGDKARAKELMKEPLPCAVVVELVSRYAELRNIFTGG